MKEDNDNLIWSYFVKHFLDIIVFEYPTGLHGCKECGQINHLNYAKAMNPNCSNMYHCMLS